MLCVGAEWAKGSLHKRRETEKRTVFSRGAAVEGSSGKRKINLAILVAIAKARRNGRRKIIMV
jgi:hypothetical protein